jgi:hypothetical protein
MFKDTDINMKVIIVSFPSCKGSSLISFPWFDILFL